MLCQRTHNSPVADVADEVEVDSCINHQLTVLIGGSIKSSTDHPCCRAGIGASSHIYHTALYSHLKHSTPLWPPSLFQSKGLSKQHRKGPSGIHSAVIHIWHFHKGSELLDFFPGLLQNASLLNRPLGKTYKHFKASNLTGACAFSSFIGRSLYVVLNARFMFFLFTVRRKDCTLTITLFFFSVCVCGIFPHMNGEVLELIQQSC